MSKYSFEENDPSIEEVIRQLENFSSGGDGSALSQSDDRGKLQSLKEGLKRLADNLRCREEAIQKKEQILELAASLEQRVLERTDQLMRSEAKYRYLFYNNPMALWVLDAQTLKFIDVNESALKIYGYSREEFLAMSSVDLRPEEERLRYQNLNRATKGTQNTGTWKHRKRDGTIMHAEVFVHEIDYEGRPARLVLSHDVTDKVKIEQEMLALNRELEVRVSQRTDALQKVNGELESFTYSVSHDLRTPLRAIHGYSQMLMEDYEAKLDQEGIRLVNAVKFNARRMGQLIDDLLSFSRMGKRVMMEKETSLDRIVHELLQELEGDKKRETKIRVHQLGNAWVNEPLIRQGLQNLISNALKYSSRREVSEIEIGAKEIDGELTYYIKDNGAGFDMAYYNKLFGVFQRLHEHDEFEGTGVGLAIVQRIIHRHGGRIWAEGKVGGGATFYFTLPTP